MSGWLGETLAATGFLLALVLWLRRPAARLFGARVAYALWALPALRMLLPPLPGVHRIVVPAAVIHLPTHGSAATVAVGLVNPATLPPGEQLALPGLAPHGLAGLRTAAGAARLHEVGIDLSSLLLGIWLIGVLALLAWQAIRFRRFVRRALRNATPIGRAAGTTILIGPGVGGPVATGILRRRILLPADFAARYSRTEARLVLDHEAAHHDRGDLIANLVALIVLASQWWNPLAWAAHRAFRVDQELACDASVTARLSAGERYAYAQAVARAAGFAGPAAAAPLSAVATLKRRLAMIGREQSRTRTAAGALLVAAVIGGALLGSASGRAAQDAPGIRRATHAPTAPVGSAAPLLPAPALGALPQAPEAPQAPAAPPSAASPVPAEALRAQADALEAQAAGLQAQQAALATAARIDVAGIVRTSMEAARAGLEQGCRERGGHPAADADLAQLAECNSAGSGAEVHRSLIQARDEIAADPDFDSAEAGGALHAAVAELDRQIAELDRSEY